ncbi:MAG: thioredoxin domain-containing protein [Hungatella sp.]|mgnify:CR=1 FL=1|jgi:predicted DsbA family dithiol-disulfide isomerase|nr:thioredoxin domain-containing protein [Hungatella sp.]
MLDILFVTDFVCPYCLVAKEALRQSLEELGMEAEITLQPLELTAEPEPRVDTCHDERRKAHYQLLVEPCKELGLDMKLPPNICPRPYTRLAFEGYFYAKEQGKGEVYGDKVYRAYFIDEKDIGDMELLSDLAAESGLDREDFKQALIDGIYGKEEKEAVRHSREDLKVKSVPTIYIDGKEITLKTYTKTEMTGILRTYQ